MVTILQVIAVLVAGAIVFLAVLWVGFWMGRHTIEKTVHIPISVAGGQPVIEEDPYAEALKDQREKGEGSL
jgi:hypothetical protein